MSHTCKNCGNTFEGNFCNYCGQAAHTHEINAKYIWHDLQHGLFHFDKGILYTLWQLLIRPGHTVREYIQGKRIAHFSPVALVVVMATLYGLLYHSFHINTFKFADNDEFDYESLNEWLGHHYSLFTLATIPFYAFFSWLVFIRQNHTYTEHIVLNSFLASQRLCVAILALPFLYFAGSSEEVSLISSIMCIICIVLAYRGFAQFFINLPKWKTFLLTTLCYIMSVITLTIFIGIIIAIVE